MPSVESLTKDSGLTGLALGIGTALAVAWVLPAIGAVARPVAKAAIKSVLSTYAKVLEGAAELGESLDDLVAEARAEMASGSNPPASAHGPSARAQS